MRAHVLLFSALFIAAPLAGPATAETVRDRVGQTEITLNFADAVAAYPEFDAFLRADARTAAQNLAAEGAPRFSVTDQAAVRAGRYVSVLRRWEEDLGGAHPHTRLEALVWDAAAKDFARLDDFFDAGEPRDEALIAISHYLRETIKADVWRGSPPIEFEPLIAQATNPDAVVLSNFTISSAGGLAFHYSPYEVAPYARGAISIELPTTVFGPWLNETGRLVFR